MLSKIKNHMLKNRILYLTFLVSTIIICIVYSLQNIAPFGYNSMLTIDFFHQYGPMLGELYDRVRGGEQLIYSFNMGMGTPFIRNYMNYLSSPFNILIFFFRRENLLMAFSLIIGLKAILASVTMSYYLSKKFKTDKLYIIPLGVLYGFCAYFAAYYWNIMWLDGLVFLPLIIYGIEKLVDENKPWFYITALAIMLVANFFIGYMICLFAVIYFIGYLILKTDNFDVKKILKKCSLFGISSLLAGGLTAALLLPLFLSIASISAGASGWPHSQYYAFTFFEFLANHFTGVGSTVLASGVSNAANISVGVLGVALFFLFVINPKIKIKIKAVYLSFILIFIASFFVVELDFIWHAFHVPNDLPYRYSFLYSFVFIIIGAYAIINIKNLKFKTVAGVYVFTLILISLLYIFDYKNIEHSMIFFNVLLLTLYFMLYTLYHYYPVMKPYIPYIFILGIVLEVTVSVNHNWDVNQRIEDFYRDYDNVRTAIDFVNQRDDSLMARIERTQILTFNDPSWYGYFGQVTFSSMAYENMAILKNYLGLPGNNINSYHFRQTTPVYNLMFNIRYFIGTTLDVRRYTLFYHFNDVMVFQANHNAGLMFTVNEQVRNWNYFGTNPLYIQNEFIERATTIPSVFEPLNLLNQETIFDNGSNMIVRYTFDNPGDNMYFYSRDFGIDFMIIDDTLYFFNQNWQYFAEADEHISVHNFIDFNERYVINMRDNNEETVSVYVGYFHQHDQAFYAYTINNDRFQEAVSILEQNRVHLREFRENYIRGSVFAPTNQIMFTSIPFDKGWSVYVNEEQVETFKIGNALLGFDINPGENEIVLRFRPQGFGVGLLISITSLATLSSGFVFRKKVLKLFE